MQKISEKNVNELDYNKLVAESDDHLLIYIKQEENKIAILSSDTDNPIRLIAYLMYSNEDFRNSVFETVASMEQDKSKLN
jgi:hypothetical protein